jgi:hypothetical protein
VTSRSIKEKQERAIREADARAAEANQKAAALNERAAKLENEAAQAHLEFAKITRPRFEKFNRDAFRNKLKGKPRRIRVELPFQLEDSDSYMLATAIKGSLNAEGWTTIGPRAIKEDDVMSGMDTKMSPKHPGWGWSWRSLLRCETTSSFR